MKKSLFFLIFASMLGFSSLYGAPNDWAAAASDVQVSIAEPLLPKPDVIPLSLNNKEKDGLASLRVKPTGSMTPWYVINIPIEIKAVGVANVENKDGSSRRKKGPARFVKELSVTAYVLFKKKTASSNSEKPSDFVLLQKEITYVNIPMDKTVKKDYEEPASGAKMSVGVFVPPYLAMLLDGRVDNTKPAELEVAAMAIAPTFGGAPCRPILRKANGKSSPVSVVYDNKFKSKFEDIQWWKGNTAKHFATVDEQMLCISETPWASTYWVAYPATRPLYGAPTAASATADAENKEDSSDTESSSSSSSSSNKKSSSSTTTSTTTSSVED